MQKIVRIIFKAVLSIVALLAVFIAAISVSYHIKSTKLMRNLRDEGYENLVSVGDYKLNVLKVGNEEGEHTFVCCAGLNDGTMNFAWRDMTGPLEADNQFIFIDRAGYGFSEDTKSDRTIERIVEDYRTALKNSGEEGPYLLMGHSIGGMYISYWQNMYPDEIEGVIIIDGTLCTTVDDVFAESIAKQWKILRSLEVLGLEPFLMKKYYGSALDGRSSDYVDNTLYMFSRTTASEASISEAYMIKRNAEELYSSLSPNDIPKIFIDASYKYEQDPDGMANFWNPYAEKMGNCTLIPVEGKHTVYIDDPETITSIIKGFLEGE